MTAIVRRCVLSNWVDRHFAGRIAPHAERRLRRHLLHCEACRTRYERWLVLAEIDTAIPSPADRLAFGLGLRRPSAGGRLRGLSWALAAAVMGLGLGLFWARSPSRRVATLGPAIPAPSAEAEFAVYSVGRDGGKAALLHPEANIAPDEPLGFAYAKAGGAKHLMIFGVGAHRRVIWYEPAMAKSPAAAPLLPITHGELVHELAAAFTQSKFDEGTLHLFAVFTNREDLRISEVEAVVAEALPEFTLGLPGCEVRHLRLNVRGTL